MDDRKGGGYLGDMLGGGVKCFALKPLSSTSGSSSGKGEWNTVRVFLGEAGEMHMKGMGEWACCMVKRTAGLTKVRGKYYGDLRR